MHVCFVYVRYYTYCVSGFQKKSVTDYNQINLGISYISNNKSLELFKIIKSIDGCEMVKTVENSFLTVNDGLTISLEQGKKSRQSFEIKKLLSWLRYDIIIPQK